MPPPDKRPDEAYLERLERLLLTMERAQHALEAHTADSELSKNLMAANTDIQLANQRLEDLKAKLSGVDLGILQHRLTELERKDETRASRGWEIKAMFISNIISLLAAAAAVYFGLSK